MANFFISPNMQLTIPTPTVDPGPDWANNINNSLINIDGHNHAPGSGVIITPQGINISIDLPFNSNNAISVRTVRFANQPTSIDATLPANANDVGCIYEAAGDLWYNNASAHSIQLTIGNSVVGPPGSITGLPVGGPAGVSYVSSTGTFIFVQDIATAANIDVGTVIVRFPGSYPTPAGNFIALRAPATLASQINLTLPFPPSSGSQLLQLDSTGLISTTQTVSSATADNIGLAMTSVGANAIASNITVIPSSVADVIGSAMTSVGANSIAAARTRQTGTNVVGLGGVAVSSPINFTSSLSGTAETIPASSVTLTTSGRPVRLQFISVPSTASTIRINGTGFIASLGITYFAQLIMLRNSSTNLGQPQIGFQFINVPNNLNSFSIDYMSSIYSIIDILAPAGVNNYIVQCFLLGPPGTLIISNTQLIAYEL